MAIDAIGSTVGSSGANDATQRAGLRQDDFIRLFVAQLNFQDPLEPVDNREFLAQLAQFAGLEQARVTGEGVTSLVTMSATDQSIGILGRQVEVASDGGPLTGTVTAIEFGSNGPTISVQTTAGAALTGLRLSQIRLVRP